MWVIFVKIKSQFGNVFPCFFPAKSRTTLGCVFLCNIDMERVREEIKRCLAFQSKSQNLEEGYMGGGGGNMQDGHEGIEGCNTK